MDEANQVGEIYARCVGCGGRPGEHAYDCPTDGIRILEESEAPSVDAPTLGTGEPRIPHEVAMRRIEAQFQKIEEIFTKARIGIHNATLDLRECKDVQEWLAQRDRIRASLVDTNSQVMGIILGILPIE